MKRFLAFLSLAVLLTAASACSDKKPPTQSAVKGNSVITTLQDLSHMYEKKNLPGFMNSVSASFKDRQAFSSTVDDIFKKYETVRFTVQYTKMIITIDDKGVPKASFNWDSEWRTGGGSMQKNNGTSVFVFDPKDSRLVSIEGKSPFVPQAAEMPVEKK